MVTYTSTDPPQCPKCQSLDCEYLGFEDTETYECRRCDELFGYTNPLHT